MALSFSHPPSPQRPSRRPFSLSSFSSFTPISPISPTPPSYSEEWPQLQPSTPDSIQGSTTTASEYSTPLTAPQPDSPSVLPAWKAVPPTPPSFIPLSSPSRPPSRRRSHPRPASAILLGTRTPATQRRLSLPTRAMRTPTSTGPPSAFLTHQRCSSLGSAARRLFHIAGDDPASDDDGDDPDIEQDHCYISPVEDEVIPKRSALERHHALLELLVSERNYLVELRTLVNVYLEQLPLLISPRILALPLLSPSYSATFPFGKPEEAPKDKDKERDKEREKRALLSDAELNTIRRNASELLGLHEELFTMLTDTIRVSGWVTGLNALEASEEFGSEPSITDSEDAEGCFEIALISVATLFTAQAATFRAYGAFCAEHPGAIEIVKNLQRKRPVEWDAFERRCTALVAASLAHAGGSPERRNNPVEEEEEASLKEQCPDTDSDGKDPEISHVQRQPTTPLDNHPNWRSRSYHDLTRATVTVSKDTKKENLTDRDPRLRMLFTDYLIKPVQRICRYHLLLGPLTLEREPKVPIGADAVVMDAKQAMADVAALVDNANFSYLQLLQTSRISARLSAPATVLSFIRTLSPCALAGSLDVVRAPALKAKYLAAFLYEGGFLALAKVTRGPRYELRYWFSLEGFELYDATDGDPLLPYSFRLCNQGHEFEIAASCQREKRVWMEALSACLLSTPTWPPSTAPSSLEPASTAAEPHSPVDEQGPSLPTIQSVPEIERSHRQGSPSSPQRQAPRTEVPDARGFSEPPPSRRESTASMRSIFGPVIDSDAVIVTRVSPQARATIDALLEDVFSAACQSARCYAGAHSEALFHVAPTFGAAARSRITKRESVVVRRRRSQADLIDQAQTVKPARKAQPSPALMLECITSVEKDGVPTMVPSTEGLFDSPMVISQCSSTTGSRAGSSAASPLSDVLELPSSLPDSSSPSGSELKSLGTGSEDLLAARESPPKRSRSLIDNFRGFILPHSSPPVRTLSVSRLSLLPAPSSPSSPARRRSLWHESFRRRSRSSPYVSADILGPATAAAVTRHSDEHAAPETISPAMSAATLPPAQRHSLEEPQTEKPPTEGSRPLLHSTPPSPNSRRTCFSSGPRSSPTTPRTMLRSIFASFSRSPSSTNVAPGL